MANRLRERLYLLLSVGKHPNRQQSPHRRTRDPESKVLGRLCRHCGSGCSNVDQNHRVLLLGLLLGLLTALEGLVGVIPVKVSLLIQTNDWKPYYFQLLYTM